MLVRYRHGYPAVMRILIVGEEPEIAAWLARRRALGQYGFDEVWEGVHHVPRMRAPRTPRSPSK